jgi:hypothetical protein
MSFVATIVGLLVLQLSAGTWQSQIPVVNVMTAEGDHVVLDIAVRDGAPADVAAVAALSIRVDGREREHVLLTPGAPRRSYDALVGPLSAGRHTIAVERSSLWPWPDAFEVTGIAPRVVSSASTSEDAMLLAYAPTIGVRADTIGTASDVPLLVYVEDDRRDGKGWIRYSAIMSHEDGGTATPALMARWGRTTDIELMYEVEVDGDRLVRDRFQGPDHEIRAFSGTRDGHHPALLLATLNNMFIDRGRSLVCVRPVPRKVNLDGRTRESVMDENPWIYPVMARELVAEKRIGTEIEDPREFLYVEAGLTLEHAAASVRVESAAGAGASHDSTRGRADLAVNRNGWVRIAVHAPTQMSSLRWECRGLSSTPAGAAPRCQIEWKRVFRLKRDYLPGENLISPGNVQLGVGLSESVALTDR